MKGFDPKWRDFPHYIIGITKEIWEERGVATLNHYYATDLIFRMASGIGQGNQHVIAATLGTLAEFPDRQLLAEDVIWSGSPEAGMLSSHRVYCHATHTGYGQFGKPTGKRINFRAMADCHAKNNVIDDEWLIRDHGAICRQLGREPAEVARTLTSRPFTPDQDIPGPYRGKGNEHESGQDFARTLQRIMQADMAVIRETYDRACSLHYPGGQQVRGYAEAENFWVGLRAALPSARFSIDHQIGRFDKDLGRRAAIRWSLQGKHDGWGCFGAPSGAEVYIMGCSHAEFGPWGIRAEFTLFDEVAVWQQIHAHTG